MGGGVEEDEAARQVVEWEWGGLAREAYRVYTLVSYKLAHMDICKNAVFVCKFNVNTKSTFKDIFQCLQA